jgi:regulator of nucleoside diphosphate kinase
MQNRMIYITEFDLERLEDLLSYNDFPSRDKNHINELQNELAKGKVVAPHEVPADVITMNSTVRFKDIESDEEFIFSLVFPDKADLQENKISILAPIGTALLGYRVGDVIECRVPGGMRRLIVKDILYQPEAAGDYNL